MNKVVMYRERWFKVLMGENYRINARTTEELADRLPLPQSIVEDLSFKLAV